jgi:hypothetical protein
MPTRSLTEVKIKLEMCPNHTCVLDFSFLTNRPQFQKLCIEMIGILGDSVAAITKRQYLRSVRNFSYFLDEYEDKNDLAHHESSDIDLKLLLNFKIWLETRPLLNNTKSFKSGEEEERGKSSDEFLSTNSIYCIYNVLSKFIERAKNFRASWFPLLPAKLPRWSRSSKDCKPINDVLGVEDLEHILAAAKCETDRIRAAYDQMQKLLKQTEMLPVLPLDYRRPDEYWSKIENVAHTFVRENGLVAPISKKIYDALWRYHKIPFKKLIGMYIPMGEASLLPFALQLYILTGLNVSSLQTLTRDCIENFPLPQYKRLRYDKPRSGNRRAKSQLFPAHPINTHSNKENPIEIIEFLIRWTEPLVEHTEERLRNCLFLYKRVNSKTGTRNVVRAVSKYDAFAAPFQDFLNRYRESHHLPFFNLKDLRPAVATYLYFQSRDIFRVQRFLGHSHITTTTAYIRGRVIAAEHDKSMANAIEEVIRRITTSSVNISSAGKQQNTLPILPTVIEGNLDEISANAKTINLEGTDAVLLRESGVMTFVARCTQPHKPPASLNVPPGQICTKIYKCLTCPNAVVLEEDLPIVLTRIRKIWEERKRISAEGWQVLYADAWLTLNQVARLFSKEALERAQKLIESTALLSTDN